MAKKRAKKKSNKKCCSGKGLWLIAAIVFGAFGFATVFQGVLEQIRQGFSYGFFAYMLGFIFFALAGFCKRRVMC